MLDALRGEGVEIAEERKAAEVRGKAGAIEVEAEDGRVFTGSHLLMAVGRKANTERLDLDEAGIETTKRGIKVDDGLRTHQPAASMPSATWRAGCNSPMSRAITRAS